MAGLRPEYIVVHTAAYDGPNCDRDMIDRWHRDRGWRCIGYHYVILNDKHDSLPDGEVQEGREISMVGAHVRGLNQRSIGICCVGHGDYGPLTERQNASLVSLVSDLIDQYENLKVEDVIGHRGVNKLVANGILRREYRTTKTCPGRKVDMAKVREEICQFRERQEEVPSAPGAPTADKREVAAALDVLSRVPTDMFPNAGAELREFLTHPEVIVFRS